MTRPRRARARSDALTDVAWALLTDQPVPKRTEAEDWEGFVLTDPKGDDPSPTVKGLRRLWEENQEAILLEWAMEFPGTRPMCWWRWSSPRWHRQADLGEPRRKVGGANTPIYETQQWHFLETDFRVGVPKIWERDGVPAFVEAEAAYLKRHGLFLPGEERRLTAADFESERVDVEA